MKRRSIFAPLRSAAAARAALAAAAACLLFGAAGPAAAADTYIITDLGVLGTGAAGSGFSAAFGLNSLGHVAGWSTTNNGFDHAALWQDGNAVDLGMLGMNPVSGSYSSTAYSLSDAGQIAGASDTPDGWRAVLWENGQATVLGLLATDGFLRAGAAAYGINGSGQIVGASTADLGTSHAALWHNGQITDLGTLGSGALGGDPFGYSAATSINAMGRIVGYSSTPDGTGEHAVVWENGQISDLGMFGTDPFGPGNSVAVSINGSGQIVGYSSTPGGGGDHAALWHNGQITDLGTLGSGALGGDPFGYSAATGINDGGRIVGYSSTPDGTGEHAVVWENGSPIDLNRQIPADAGWELIEANAVNASGQIAGYGTIGGVTHAFLLTPVPDNGSGGGSITQVDAAAFVSQTVPTEMVSGRQYPVIVTLRNTGTTTWTGNDLYRLGSQNFQDNNTWGSARIELPHPITPGQEVTFTFTVTAPDPGLRDFQWRMVHDLVTWFGDYTPNVVVNVSAPPIPLAAADDGYATDEDTALAVAAPGVLANDTPPGVRAVVVSPPASGSLALNADGSFTYTPSPDFNGVDRFTYTANNGQADSNVATVTITVNSVNDAPLAQNDAATTNEDMPVSVAVLINDTDTDGDALVLDSVTPGANGVTAISADGARAVYTPNPRFSGVDRFTYTVRDDQGGRATATVTVTVVPVNHPPVAAGQTVVTAQNTPASITLRASDADGNALSYTIVSGPAHGTLSGTGETKVYTPARNYNGPDSFTFKANDGQADSNVAAVTISVTPVNAPPVAEPDKATTKPGQSVTIAVLNNDRDPNGDALRVTGATQPANGRTVVNSDNTITYTPSASFTGTDTFTYTISDGRGGTSTATVTLTVQKPGGKPR